jgi:hypothetical protein
MRFRVGYITDKRKSALILVRRLDAGDFTLGEGAHLGPVAIHAEVSMPRGRRASMSARLGAGSGA